MSVRNLVLVHGAWAGGWVWDSMLEPLRELGFNPVVVTLPGVGVLDKGVAVDVDTMTDCVVAVLDVLDGPSVLVGHSGGGIVVSQVAERVPAAVAGIVYVAGMMLPSGMDFGMLCGELELPAPVGISRWLVSSDDGFSTVVPPEAGVAVFFHEAPVADAIAAARQLIPQQETARLMAPTITPERFGTVARLYVECTLDRTVPIEAQRGMQQRVPGAAVVSLATDHAPQLSARTELVRVVTEFAGDVLSRTRHPEPAAVGPNS